MPQFSMLRSSSRVKLLESRIPDVEEGECRCVFRQLHSGQVSVRMHGKNREGCSVGQNQFVVRERIVGADQLFESRASRQVERFEIVVVAAQAAQFVQPCDLQSVGLAGRVGHDVGLLEILERGKVELGAAAEHYPQILEFGELENLLHGGERGNFAALEPLQRGEIPDASPSLT